MNTNSIFTTIVQVQGFVHTMNEYAFENPNVQKLIHSTDLHYDVVINEEFFADSFLMFAHKFRAPTITMCEYVYSLRCLINKKKVLFVYHRSIWYYEFYR